MFRMFTKDGCFSFFFFILLNIKAEMVSDFQPGIRVFVVALIRKIIEFDIKYLPNKLINLAK